MIKYHYYYFFFPNSRCIVSIFRGNLISFWPKNFVKAICVLFTARWVSCARPPTLRRVDLLRVILFIIRGLFRIENRPSILRFEFILGVVGWRFVSYATSNRSNTRIYLSTLFRAAFDV